MKLTPTEDLIMEVLASRYRLGERFWPFGTNVTKQLEHLRDVGLVWLMDGTGPRTIRAGLTEDGKAEWLSATYTSPTPVGKEEFAVETRTSLDGPWDRIDTGTTWSNRNGMPYTEEEASAEAAQRYNGIDPKLWRRVVHRFVSPWEPVE